VIRVHAFVNLHFGTLDPKTVPWARFRSLSPPLVVWIFLYHVPPTCPAAVLLPVFFLNQSVVPQRQVHHGVHHPNGLCNSPKALFLYLPRHCSSLTSRRRFFLHRGFPPSFLVTKITPPVSFPSFRRIDFIPSQSPTPLCIESPVDHFLLRFSPLIKWCFSLLRFRHAPHLHRGVETCTTLTCLFSPISFFFVLQFFLGDFSPVILPSFLQPCTWLCRELYYEYSPPITFFPSQVTPGLRRLVFRESR